MDLGELSCLWGEHVKATSQKGEKGELLGGAGL